MTTDARSAAAGDGATPPVLLIHGVTAGPRCWERCLPLLDLPTAPIVPDLTAAPGRLGRYPLTRAMDELAAELARRGVRHATVVGHSMGGLLAILLAAAHPDAVGRIVLVATPALPLPGGLVGRGGAVLGSTGRTDPATFPLLVTGLWRMGPVRLWDALRQILASDLRAELAAMQLPTLLVWGADDVIVPPSVGEQIRGLVPGSRLALIPGAGHMPMWERPDAFVDAIGPFLAAADSGPVVSSPRG